MLFGVQVLPAYAVVVHYGAAHPFYRGFPFLLLFFCLLFAFFSWKRPWIRMVPAITYFGLISLLSSTHSVTRKPVSGFLFHPVEFFYLALFIAWARYPDRNRPLSGVFIWTVGLGFLAAVLDEIHQYFVPGRFGDPKDVLLDMIGVFAGTLAFTVLARKGLFHENASATQ